MDKSKFKQLAKKYFSDELTEEELKEFLSMLKEQEDEFYKAVDAEINLDHTSDFDKDAAFERLTQDRRFAEPRRIRHLKPYIWTAAACSVLIVLSFLMYFNQQGLQHPGQKKTTIVQKTSAAGEQEQYSAIRLADGTQLALTDIGENVLNYNGIKLSRISANLYKVSIDSQSHVSKRPYHEFTTAKGISYALLLPDGSKVDLNSGSTLRLHPSFNVLNRNCELSGEAYFDVKRNEAMAFRVKTRDYDVKVLGTQFNIKSYANTNYSHTALIKGNVHVVNGSKEVNLLPGEQVRAEAGALQNKNKANLRDVLAWKEGYFRFTNATIEDIMLDITTWYNIDHVDYQYTSDESFTGSIVRTRSLTDVLASIERISDLQFEIKEGRVIVRK